MKSSPCYFGLDVGGKGNTWLVQLGMTQEKKLFLREEPMSVSHKDLLEKVIEHEPLGIAIDAHLTWSTEDSEAGFRASDERAKKGLEGEENNWVQSYNSMMTIPTVGRQLADLVTPYVGTVIETHPRLNLFQAFYKEKKYREAVFEYKKNGDKKKEVQTLWDNWMERMSIHDQKISSGNLNDNQLDAMVCATICYLFHQSPWKLKRLSENPVPEGEKRNFNVRGFGPFYILAPGK